MRHAALSIKNNNLSTEARLVLFRLLARFGPGITQAQHLKALLDELRVPYAFGSKAIAELVRAGLLHKHGVVPPRKRGRPLSSYVSASEILNRFDRGRAESCVHLHRIDLVLSIDIRNRSKPPEHSGGVPQVRGIGERLSAKDLWLLGVLLDHADDLGVVSTLSRATLTMLTGMKAKPLIRRLQKLVKLDLLYSAVPWARSKQLSCTMNPLVHLNLNAPMFGQEVRPVAPIHFPFLPPELTDGSAAPSTESLPLVPFSLAKIAALEHIFLRIDQTEFREGDADVEENPADHDGESSDWLDEEDEEALEAREQAEIDLREKRRQQAQLQRSLPGILNVIKNSKADRAWAEGLEIHFQDFNNPRVLEWFRARIMLCSLHP